MAEKVEDKTVELMDRAAGAIEAFAIKLGALSTEYGPEVVDAALWVARIDALNSISVSFMLVLFASILLYYNSKVWAWATKIAKEDSDGFIYIASAIYSAIWILPFIVAGIRLFNPWPWVGIIEPQLWIAKRILGL